MRLSDHRKKAWLSVFLTSQPWPRPRQRPESGRWRELMSGQASNFQTEAESPPVLGYSDAELSPLRHLYRQLCSEVQCHASYHVQETSQSFPIDGRLERLQRFADGPQARTQTQSWRQHPSLCLSQPWR